MATVLVDFVMNNKFEMFIIGLIEYKTTGEVMRFFDIKFDVRFRKKGGKRLWFATALMISGLYHWIKVLFV